MQYFKFVNWRICGFVFWCHEQAINVFLDLLDNLFLPPLANVNYTCENLFKHTVIIITFIRKWSTRNCSKTLIKFSGNVIKRSTFWCVIPRVSLQGVKSLGIHFSCLCWGLACTALFAIPNLTLIDFRYQLQNPVIQTKQTNKNGRTRTTHIQPLLRRDGRHLSDGVQRHGRGLRHGQVR